MDINMAWKCVRSLVQKNFKLYFAGRKIFCAVPVPNLLYSRVMMSSNPNCNVGKNSNLTALEKNFRESSFNNVLKEVSNTTDHQKRTSFKALKYTFWIVGISVTLFGSYLVLKYGQPISDAKGDLINDDLSKHVIWREYLLRALKQIENFAVFIQEPSREKLLPDPVTYPFYQPPYTLVLELTDVLAHPDWTYKTGWRFKKRPGLDYLLENLVGMYEIVVFTAEPGITIFPVIEALDQKNLISYKLVRDSTHFVNGHHVKNLDRLNRDLKKVIVVDWNEESVKFHPDNHLNIKRWKGENEDSGLVDLTSFLKTIAHTEIDDVREVLKFYKQFDDPLAEFRKKQREYFEHQASLESSKGQPIKKVFDYIM